MKMSEQNSLRSIPNRPQLALKNAVSAGVVQDRASANRPNLSEPAFEKLISRAYIGLGSNLAGPLGQISTALLALQELPETTLLDCSGLYRNRAMTDPLASPATTQPDFLNAVAAIDTSMTAQDLLKALLNQEIIQGRRRSGQHWEARCIDLDLLLYGEQQIQSHTLTVPHPGLHQRPFVIHPLVEIAPLIVIPGFGPAAQVAKIIPTDSLTLVCQGNELME